MIQLKAKLGLHSRKKQDKVDKLLEITLVAKPSRLMIALTRSKLLTLFNKFTKFKSVIPMMEF